MSAKPRIEELTLAEDDPRSEAWVAVHNAAARAARGPEAQQTTVEEILDLTPRRAEIRRTFALWMDSEPGGTDIELGAADTEPGAPVAVAQTIRHTRENTDTGGIWLSVAPDRQRRGLGSRLLEHCEQVLREEGCTRVHDHSDSVVESGDAASGFAVARGYRQTLLHLGQDLALPVAEEALAAAFPRLDPAAYVVETAVDRLPEEWLEDRAVLASRMSTDAPTGEIDLEEEVWDADRVRQQWNTPSPIWAVETVARHVPSGRLVGFTDLVVRPGTPHLAVQTDTLVLREHRGHALGLAMKVANLRALQREKPEVTSIRTWNADTNTHMLAINRELGFLVTGWSREWAKEL